MSKGERYSKVSRRMWNDARFRRLSPSPPCAQFLWFRLLTGPELTPVPGCFQAWSAGLSQSLGWSNEDFLAQFAQLEEAQMAVADWANGLVWIPKAIDHNPPESPNVVVSWRAAIAELPDCDLLDRVVLEIEAFLVDLGPTWIRAWRIGDGRARRPRLKDEVREQVRKRDKDHCRYCEVKVDWSDRRGPLAATYDHVDPDGDSSISNIVVCCRSCNSKKSTRSPEECGLKRPQIGPGPRPKSGPRSDPGLAQVGNHPPSSNQEQEQEQEREEPPTPLPEAAPGKRPESAIHLAAPANTNPGTRRTDRPRDPFTHRPADREDVRRVHEAWKSRFGFHGHKFRRADDLDAEAIAEAIDAHGERDCLVVCDHAPNDRMVNGTADERGLKHDSIKYIFGNPQTFARILREAQKQIRSSEESIEDRFARLEQM